MGVLKNGNVCLKRGGKKMAYKLIRKARVLIASEWMMVVPMSHEFETREEAMRWMMERGMQGECEVVGSGKMMFEPAVGG